MKAEITIPEPFQELFTPCRYKAYYGGRGGGKSWAIALALIVIALQGKKRILCTRELQKSITDSVHKLFKDIIIEYGLTGVFNIQNTSIVSTRGSEFLFSGLRSNVSEIKSMEGIDICWVEEAQRVSEESWQVLIPTIRKEGSEIWVSFNPVDDSDPTYKRFVINPPDECISKKVNWYDNPFFPETLKKELEYDKRVDHEKYLHVWEGETRKISEALIFSGKYTVDRFDTPLDAVFYYGADWGFSQDPTTLIRCFVLDKCLYIDYEVYGVGVDIDKTPQMFDEVPDSRKWPIIADSARPETISYMNKNGFNIKSAKKGAGSVEDGIQFIRSFENIIIHERCKHTIYEFSNYSYKVDKQNNRVLPIPEDKHNHCMDGLRYGLEPIQKVKPLFIGRV